MSRRRERMDAQLDHMMEYVIQYSKKHRGRFPSHREIQQACGLSSTSMVSYYLRELALFGKLEIHQEQSGMARQYEVVGGEWSYHG